MRKIIVGAFAFTALAVATVSIIAPAGAQTTCRTICNQYMCTTTCN